MPLSAPVKRKHRHTREIRCFGYERDDGLWDIEGRIIDIKTYSFENKDRGTIASGEPVHEMWIRLTVDDNLVVRKAEASTEASPFNICPMITSGVASLKGERIAPGWSKAVHRAIGGVKGCTHINQMLLGPVATTAYQTIVPLNNSRNKNKKVTSKPAIINTCHAFAADGAIVKSSWPDYYQGKD